MYLTAQKPRKKKKKGLSASDAIARTNRLGSLLGASVRRDEIGNFGTSIFRSDASDDILKPRIDWDIVFPTPETEISRIKRERREEIEANHLRKGI